MQEAPQNSAVPFFFFFFDQREEQSILEEHDYQPMK
jgi:hypothetical protein